MEQEVILRIHLTAAEGMTLTNGETFSKEVYLGSWDDPSNWYEITDEEAAALQPKEEEFEQGE